MAEKYDSSPGKRKRARGPNHVAPKLAKIPRPPASQPANHEIAGYMPGRREFDQDLENDAEQIVKDISFDEDDTEDDTRLKCAVLNSYNRILSLRKARKDFIFDRNFVDFRKIQSNEKKRPKEEKDLYQKYRVFARMQTADDFEEFMGGMIRISKCNIDELRLRQKIAQLQEYLRMGVKSIRESVDYEKEKTTRVLFV